jgi:hypothetical protein
MQNFSPKTLKEETGWHRHRQKCNIEQGVMDDVD